MNVSTAQIAAPFVTQSPVVMDCKLDRIFYGNFMAVRDSHVPIEKNKITGFIGPSGCGKSTVLRSLNRMNDLVKGFRFEGHVHFLGRMCMARASTRSSCVGISAWCSSSPTRSR